MLEVQALFNVEELDSSAWRKGSFGFEGSIDKIVDGCMGSISIDNCGESFVKEVEKAAPTHLRAVLVCSGQAEGSSLLSCIGMLEKECAVGGVWCGRGIAYCKKILLVEGVA
jgi:hypothetical protein